MLIVSEIYLSEFKKITNVSNLDQKPKSRVCEETFEHVSHLNNHMTAHENECDSCTNSFLNEGDFIYHLTNNHKEAAVMFLD